MSGNPMDNPVPSRFPSEADETRWRVFESSLTSEQKEKYVNCVNTEERWLVFESDMTPDQKMRFENQVNYQRNLEIGRFLAGFPVDESRIPHGIITEYKWNIHMSSMTDEQRLTFRDFINHSVAKHENMASYHDHCFHQTNKVNQLF